MCNQEKTYFVYLGRSLLPNESNCITCGITHIGYRDYLKVMEIFYSIPAQNKSHALAIEKEAHIYLDKHFEPRAFVRWSKSHFEMANIDIGTSPTRTNEWWLIPNIDTVMNNPFSEIYELLRNRQINWKEGINYGKAKANKGRINKKFNEEEKTH